MEKIKIIALVGSLRNDSLNRQLAHEAGEILDKLAGKASKKLDFLIPDYSDVPMFNRDIEYPAPRAISGLREIIKSANGVWFFTPEYNHFFPGVLKNLIDWLSRPISETEQQVLAGKAAAISGITPGISGTLIAQDHLVTLFSFLNMKIMNQPRLSIPRAMEQTDQDGRLKLDTSRQFLEKQAEAFLGFIERQFILYSKIT